MFAQVIDTRIPNIIDRKVKGIGNKFTLDPLYPAVQSRLSHQAKTVRPSSQADGLFLYTVHNECSNWRRANASRHALLDSKSVCVIEEVVCV